MPVLFVLTLLLFLALGGNTLISHFEKTSTVEFDYPWSLAVTGIALVLLIYISIQTF